jgi:hypothetical protein
MIYIKYFISLIVLFKDYASRKHYLLMSVMRVSTYLHSAPSLDNYTSRLVLLMPLILIRSITIHR